MKYISTLFRLNRLALVAAALIGGMAVYGQTTINADDTIKAKINNPPYGNTTEMPGWQTFRSDRYYKHGGTVSADNTTQVTYNDRQYPTFDLTNGQDDAVKFYLGKGSGSVKVYYKEPEGEQVSYGKSHLDAHHYGSAYANTVTTDAWGGFRWNVDPQGNRNIKFRDLQVDVESGGVGFRLIVEYWDQSDTDMSDDNWPSKTHYSVSQNAAHADWNVKSIWFHTGGSSGSYTIKSVKFQGNNGNDITLGMDHFEANHDNADRFSYPAATPVTTDAWGSFYWYIDNEINHHIKFKDLKVNTAADGVGMRLIVEYWDHSENDMSDDGWPSKTQYTVNQNPAHADWDVRRIWFHTGGTAGSYTINSVTFNGTHVPVVNTSTSLTLDPSDGSSANTTSLNGKLLTFNQAWQGFQWNVDNMNDVKLNELRLRVNKTGIEAGNVATVRMVVHYEGCADGDNDATEFVNIESLITDTKPYYTFTVRPSAAHVGLNVKDVFIQPSTSGKLTLVDCVLDGYEERLAEVRPVLKRSQTQICDGLTYTNGSDGTKVMTYNFDFSSGDASTREEFWLTGGHVGVIEIDYDDSTIISAPNLSPITDDFMWYYNGGNGLYTPYYKHNNHIYVWPRKDADGNTRGIGVTPVDNEHSTSPVTNKGIRVNGKWLETTSNGGGYRLVQGEAIGFKLKRGQTYVIRVFSDSESPLFHGDNAFSSTAVTGSVTPINVDQYTETTTKLFTYEVDGNDDFYWIRGNSSGLNLGGFEVCPVANVDTNPDIARRPAQEFAWYIDDVVTTGVNQNGTPNTPDVVKTGYNGNYVYLYGPTMASNDFSIGHGSVLLNNQNRVYVKVPAGSKISFTVAADPGRKVVIHHNGGDTEYTTVGEFTDCEYTSSGDELVYISGGNGEYFYFQGFTIEPAPVKEADVTNLKSITDDFVFYSRSVIPAAQIFASDYLANNGVAKAVLNDEDIKVDGAMRGVYDITRPGESIRFTVASTVADYEVRVHYKDAIPSTPMHKNVTDFDTYDWAATDQQVQHNGRSVTFRYNYTLPAGADVSTAPGVQYPGAGILLNVPAGTYNGVTFTVDNPDDLYWHIVVCYTDGFDGASTYTTGSTCTASIDPTRAVTGIVVQGAISTNRTNVSGNIVSGETKTVTFTDIALSRIGNSAGENYTTSLHKGTLSSDPVSVGATKFTLEGSNVISYRVTGNTAATDYYVEGGLVASVQVLVANRDGFNTATLNAIAPEPTDDMYAWSYVWNVQDGLAKAPNHPNTDNMVLNAHKYHDGSKVFFYGEPVDWYGNPKMGMDVAMNATQVNSNSTILFDNYHAVGLKLSPRLDSGNNPVATRYKITAYWAPCDGAGKIAFMQRNDIYARNHGDGSVVDYQPNTTSTDAAVQAKAALAQERPAVYYVDVNSADQIVWICADNSNPVYFSGFKVEIAQDYGIFFDTDVPGIFTGTYKFAGDASTAADNEDKLLIYCTDNGTYECFRMPIVNFHNAVANSDKDITIGDPDDPTNANWKIAFKNIAKLKLPYATKVASGDNSAQAIIADGQLPVVNDGNITMKNVYRIRGFEDTDQDNLYRVEYSYKYKADDSSPEVEYKNHFYVWFANYLKVGWSTNREAKLIVGTDKSQSDPDHIIVGEFYISAGETGDFFYDIINPGKDTSDNTLPDFGNAVFQSAEWTITTDNGGTQTKSRSFDSTATEKKANGVDDETFSWTKMNDHKNHLADAIELAFPTNYNPAQWPGSEVVKTVSFRAKRGGGWPDWTAKLTFHFVGAPKIELVSTSTTHKEVKMTGYNGSYTTPAAGSQVYYTTDGTVPTFDLSTNTPTPTNATYTYSGNVTNHKLAIYYAAELLQMPRKFYIHNPYTTHIEGKSMYDLMATYNNNGQLNPNDNITDRFVSLSLEYEAPVADPLVEFLDENRDITKKDGTNNYVTTTQFDEWGVAGDWHGVSALGAGGFLYKYPFNHNRRDLMVQFGNSTKRVYRKENDVYKFWNVGMYWDVDENDSFKEHFESNIMHYKTIGENYEAKYGKPVDELGQTSENGNPHTECNGGLGGEHTEQGGMFLQPITGDFLRLEPEYDGVVTLWMRQNGAGQGNEEWGDITRRPVYVVDENGVVMKRSSIKPSSEHYFGIDGFYAEICSHSSLIRHDFRNDWVNGLANWKRGFKTESDPLPVRNMATFRLYNYWYGFPMYQRKNDLNHTNSDYNMQSAGYYRWTMDVADSWVSRTSNVKSVQCEFNPIVYHSEQLHSQVEDHYTFRDQDGDKKTILDGDKFAKYGWELPAFNVVRYRIPVKAGKSYYIGGRGTKNGYMGMKFEPLPPNYIPADYVHADNRYIYEDSTATHNAFVAYGGVTPGINAGAEDNYDPAAMRALYKDGTSYTLSDRLYGNGTYTYRQYDLYASDNDDDQLDGYGNYWYGASQGQGNAGHANLLYIDYGTTKFDQNHMVPMVDQNTLRGHSCDVKLHRTFTKGYWHPIVLPFSVNETRLKEIFGDEVQVLYLDPYDNTMPNVNVHGQGKRGQWNSALRPAIIESELKFTYHHYQMLYANTPAFICPGGRIKTESVNGGNVTYGWSSDWTTIVDPVFHRVTLDRTNVFSDGSYEKDNRVCGYKIGEVGQYEFWVTGCYTPGEKVGDMYYLTNERATQDGVDKVRATIYHSPNKKTMRATRCWIETRPKTGAGGVPPMLRNVGFGSFDENDMCDDPSGIIDIVIDEDEYTFGDGVYDDNVYDVLGRQVGYGSTDGLPAGVYIFHGKKVYVR